MANINCIAESKDGTMWLGSNGGDLIEFDGFNFSEVNFGALNNHHFNNVITTDDEILFSSNYLGFYSYSRTDKKLTKFNLENHLYGDALRVFVKDGITYFIGSRQILAKKNELKKILFFGANSSQLSIYQSFETNNSIFLLTNYGSYVLSNGEIKKLSVWMGKDVLSDSLQNFHFGSFSDNEIQLYHFNGTQQYRIKLDINDSIISIKKDKLSINLPKDDNIISFTFNSYYKRPTFLTKNGLLYFLNERKWRKNPHNYSEDLANNHFVFSSQNGDYWVLSSMKGVYKISKEPFTKIELSPLHADPSINFVYYFDSGITLISTFDGRTFLETAPNSLQFNEYNFSTNGIAEIDSIYFLATNKGMRVYEPAYSQNLDNQFYKNKNITFISSFKNELWIGIAGVGLKKYDITTHTIETPIVNGGRMPNHFYTSQISGDEKSIYFGSNAGVFALDVGGNELKKIHFNNVNLGSYSGISTTDIYGTCWFSLELGIVAITKNNNVITYKGDEYFNSTLFYTLIADDIGNIIIGTNKGLTIFKINEKAEIVNRKTYDEETNFLGYETHMRSQFKKGNDIIIGTIEGLFQINTKYLDNLPLPLVPRIKIIGNTRDDGENDVFNFEFSISNPKINRITYAYQIDGGKWNTLADNKNYVIIKELTNGEHTIMVKASYDGINYGDSIVKTISVNSSIWKSTWFIALLIGGLFLINLFLLNYYKSFDGGRLIDTKDIDVHLNLTPAILIFATITAPLTHFLGPIIDSQLSFNLETTLILAFILLSLSLSALSAKASKKFYLYGRLLRLGLFAISADYLWEIYSSKLHPYNIIGIILISTMAPYILNKIKETTIFSLFILFVSILFIIIIKDPVYPKYYFLIAISVSTFLMIFYSFLRYDSLEKLIFISAIVNRGNMPVIAFDDKGVISYSSENISNFLDISHSEILNKNITILNDFIPFDSSYKNIDVTKDFKDGQIYLTPMVDNDSKIRWMEWAYRDFSKNVKLILGQDVTEKMQLENTYELLVQNAEDFIYKCDNKGNFNFINDASFSKLGYTKEELLFTNSIRIIEEGHREEVVAFYRSHFKQKKMTSYIEFPIIKKNGEQIWVGQSITTIFAPGSEIQVDGFIALARDITAIRNQQEVIREQSDSITSSINYARRIQHNLLPLESQFKNEFKEHFIFSKPKDIVSGDFYWMENVGKNCILVLGDCTGHGVPGSFMTLLGFNLLNTTVLESKLIDPGKILDRLDKKLIEYLPRGEGENAVNDAMELTVCVFNDETNEMTYACAGSRFLIHENGEFTMFKGDNKHAGDFEEDFKGYNTHFATFSSEYNLFLFSDGFQDQFGGVNDKKYSFRRLLELFEENINLPLVEQNKIIAESFDKWIGDSEQTDDVTVVSIKREIREQE